MKFYLSKIKGAVLFLCSALFVIGGFLIVLHEESIRLQAMGVASIVFFGFGLIISPIAIFYRKQF